MASNEHDLHNLDAAARVAAKASYAPRAMVYATLAVGIGISWLLLLALATRVAPIEAGPGGALLSDLPSLPVPAALERLLRLCLSPAGLEAGQMTVFLSFLVMWLLMSIAMMLPTAAPMIRTYCEIADTAASKGETVVHPLVLLSGYLAAWFAVAMPLALISTIIQSVSRDFSSPEIGLVAAAGTLAVAGIYQFSSLKAACLKKCRRPFATLFARWSVRVVPIFRLGLQQGIWCVGCCWALMLVMFAVGLMNVFWMALIGLFTIVEKQLSGPLASRIAGAILLVWSAALLVLSQASG